MNDGDIQKMLRALANLSLLVMFDFQLRSLWNNLTSVLPNLGDLNVSRNEILNFDGKEVFGDTPPVRHLDLTQNHISIVNKTTFPESLLDTLEYLHISRNPLSCSCNDIKWFYKWLNQKENKKKIVDVEELFCQSPEHLKDKVLVDILFKDLCPISEDIINLAIGLGVSACLVLIIIFVLYISKWHIRHRLFIVRSSRRKVYLRMQHGEDYKYDGFLVYAEEDRVFVHDVLLPRLETQEGFRLCVHYRDFEVGKIIHDNIDENMNRSRKVIIVLSNHFAKSKWCEYELMIAQNRILSERSDLLLLILYKDIDFRSMSSQLRMLLTTMTYAKWSHDLAGETLFWEQVKQGLRGSNNTSSDT